MIAGEEREEGIENLFEKIMTENFTNWINKNTHKSRICRVSNKINLKRPSPRHIIIKMINVKNKEKFLKETKEDSYLHGSSHKTVS